MNPATPSSAALRLVSQSGASTLGLLDALKYGGFMLDGSGRVVSLNRIALDCLGDGLVLGGERLSAADRATDRHLQHMIGCALGRTKDVNLPKSVAVLRRSRLPLVLGAVALDHEPQRPAGSAILLLLVLDPELRREPPREILTQAFGLTPAEADTAIGIASGKTLAQIAAERGVKIGTVRAHSKIVFSKTHTRGQAELTGILTRLAFVIPPADASLTALGGGAFSAGQDKQPPGHRARVGDASRHWGE
jgi:DNA-binding CsgD family transcriptional regulator